MNIDDMDEKENKMADSGAGISGAEGSSMPSEHDIAAESGTGEAVNETAVPAEVEAEAVLSPVPLKPGAQLAEYRKAAGIEQEQVAASLKMTVRQVRDLEADNYEALHGISISRGFVRAYAKMLQVDPEPLVALFRNEAEGPSVTEPIARRHASERYTPNSQTYGSSPKSKGKLLWLIVLVLIAGAAWFAYSQNWFSGGLFKSRAQAVSENQAQTAPAESAVNSQPEASEAKSGETPASASDAVTEAKPETTSAVEGEKPAEEPAQASEASAETAEPVAQPVQNALLLRFNGPSRVQLLKQDGSVLREINGRNGDVEKIDIDEPVTLVVQRAANVEAEFRGNALALRTARRNPQARINLK